MRGSRERKAQGALPPSIIEGPPYHPDAVLTPEQCATWLQVERRQLQRAGVPHVAISHKVRRYRVRDVLAWLDRHIKEAA